MMADSGDPIIPSLDESKATFRRGFLEWSSLVQNAGATDDRVFLDHMRLVETAFPDHPRFPSSLDIKKSPGSFSATGSSSWAATIASSGPDDLAQFRQSHEIVVARSRPQLVFLDGGPDIDCSHWFGGQGHHITILILAWTYILSSRWTEIIPGAEPIRYTNIRPDPSPYHLKFDVDIGNVSADAERWWQAVLAPRQGWLATVNSEHKVLHSPWYIRLPPRTKFGVSNKSSPDTGAAASSSTALRYLADYCAIYDLADQSRAALSAVLFLPLAAFWRKRVQLPIPEEPNVAQQCAPRIPRREQRPDVFSTSQLDKLLALSCNTRGLPPILLSLFYDREVPCNLASPWLQGTFSALDRVSSDHYVLAQTLTSRDPRLGFLWVGAIILGCHTQLLQRARNDNMNMEVGLLSAMWTKTLQTFMQEPVTGLVRAGRIEREDECRLLYLASKSHQSNPPMSPWKPFGSTALEDTELDVRIHAHCQDHGLRYVGWDWDCCINGRPAEMNVPASGGLLYTHSKPNPNLITNETSQEIPYDLLDSEDNRSSWKATLNIFMWLRRDGFPSSEQCIRRHEWLCEVFDEEEADVYESWTDEEDIVTSGRQKAKSSAPRPRLGGWLASTQGMRRRSN